MSDTTFLIEFDPTGRMGAASPNEQIFVTVTTDYGMAHIDRNPVRLINGMRAIASAFSGTDIEFLDVYKQLNA